MMQVNLLGMLGTNEIVIILVIVLLLFGGRKIPELMRGLGKGGADVEGPQHQREERDRREQQ